MSSSVSLYILEMVTLRLFYNLATDVAYLSGESELTHEKLNPEQIYWSLLSVSEIHRIWRKLLILGKLNLS